MALAGGEVLCLHFSRAAVGGVHVGPAARDCRGGGQGHQVPGRGILLHLAAGPRQRGRGRKGSSGSQQAAQEKRPKGEASPRATEVEKKEKGRKPDSPPVRSQKSDSSKEERSEKKVNIKEEKQKPIEP